MRVAIVLAALAAAWSTAAAAAPSDQAVAAARAACRSSAQKLCALQIAMRDRPGVRACLVKNIDKVTPDCQASLKALQATQ